MILSRFWSRLEKTEPHALPVPLPVEPDDPIKDMRSILKEAEKLKIRMDKRGMKHSSKCMDEVLAWLVREIKMEMKEHEQA